MIISKARSIMVLLCGAILSAGCGGEISQASRDEATILVAWEPNPEPVLGYEVFYGDTVDAVDKFAADVSALDPDADLSAPAVELRSDRDLGLSKGDQVCFKVKAYDATDVSNYSAPVCTTIPG
ncbi:MAG: hypothetical protein OEU36_23925 [Gammaproteobacteria bacterium]|nr:hypothetical protein [Gammaproteobacteria bacterium]